MPRSSARATVRSSSLDEVGDRDAPSGSRPWCIYFAFEAKKIRKEMSAEVEMLRRVVGYLEEYEAHIVLGYPSLGMLLQAECDLAPEDIDAVKAAGPGATVGAVLKPLGANQHDGGCSNSTPSPIIRGTTATYLTARIARDRPDIKARLDGGEFPSVRAAAREAGIVRPTAMIYTDSPTAAARGILRHFRGDRLEALIAALSKSQ